MQVRLAEEHFPLRGFLGESRCRRQDHESCAQEGSASPAEVQTSHASLLHISLLFIIFRLHAFSNP
jgi:hypothetical protein